MITKDDALQFVKDNNNGEIFYILGKNEYAEWMAKFANYIIHNKKHKT